MGSPPGLRGEPKHPEPRAFGKPAGVGGNIRDMYAVPSADKVREEEQRKRQYAAELEAQIADRRARDRRDRDLRKQPDARPTGAYAPFVGAPQVQHFPPPQAAYQAQAAAAAAAMPQPPPYYEPTGAAAAPPPPPPVANYAQPLPAAPGAYEDPASAARRAMQAAAEAPALGAGRLPAAPVGAYPQATAEAAFAHVAKAAAEMKKAEYARELMAQMREKEERDKANKYANRLDDERVKREVAELAQRAGGAAGPAGHPPPVQLPKEEFYGAPRAVGEYSPSAQPSGAAIAMQAVPGGPMPVIRFRSDNPFGVDSAEAMAKQRQQEELQDALKLQIEEKKRRKQEEVDRERQEDAEYEARLQKERDALQEQFEREQNKEAERKKEALRALEEQQNKAQEAANRRLGKHRKRHSSPTKEEKRAARQESHAANIYVPPPAEYDDEAPSANQSPVAPRYDPRPPAGYDPRPPAGYDPRPPAAPGYGAPPQASDANMDRLRNELQREQAQIREQLHRQGRDMARLNERALSAESDADAARKELLALRQQLAEARLGGGGGGGGGGVDALRYAGAGPGAGGNVGLGGLGAYQDALGELSNAAPARGNQFGLAAELDRYDKSEVVSYERFDPPTIRKSGADGILRAANGGSIDMTASLAADSTFIPISGPGANNPLAGARLGDATSPNSKNIIDASQLYTRNQRRLEALNDLGDVASGDGPEAANQLDELLMRFVNAREGSLPPPTPSTEMGEELGAETRWITPA